MIYRNAFQKLKATNPEKIYLIENFGTQSYFSCMKHVGLVLGNSSSGIIEAASFGKYVINLGERQKGRLTSENVMHLPFKSEMIIKRTNELFAKTFTGRNIYFSENPVENIIQTLKQYS